MCAKEELLEGKEEEKGSAEGSFYPFALVLHVVLSLVYQEQNVFQTHARTESTCEWPLMNTQSRAVCWLSQMSLHRYLFISQAVFIAKSRSQGDPVDG